MTATKRKSRSRVSKNKKAYWRKGVNLDDVEEFLNTQRFDERSGGQISERKDEDLFAIDKAGQEDAVKLTRRQEAALRKRQQLAEKEADVELKPSKRLLKQKLLKSPKSKSLRTSRSASSAESSDFIKEVKDLWAEEEVEAASVGQEYFEKATKRRQPRRPKTLQHISTLLPTVESPQAGASYNPSMRSYQLYVKKIADDELELEKREEKLKRNIELPPGESYVTQEEKLAEESAGLFNEEAENADDTPAAEDGKKSKISKPTLTERKTRKEIQRKALEKKMDIEKKHLRELKDKEQHVFATRKLNKEIGKTMTEREKKSKARKKSKALKKLLNPQRLGRGKFEDVKEAFLTPEELPATLRQLKPQGDILAERLKSLQKRNVLPVPGKRIKSGLRKRLKVKEVERRSHKDVTVGSHLKQ